MKSRPNQALPSLVMMLASGFYSAITHADDGFAITGGLTSAYQTTSDSRIKPEFTTSADLVLTYARGRGEWRLYAEGNSTPRTAGVSSVLPEANADAGSALDRHRRGRLQVSELNYMHRFDAGMSITAGLVDASGYFDQSRIASDENTQFLGVSFVQNPTIEFPDYALGLVYEQGLNANTVWRVGVTGSHGLANNPNLSYAQLVNVGGDNKGVFAISSLTWKNPLWLTRVGLWTNTAPHDSLDGTDTGRVNSGVYWLGGWRLAAHGANLRLGLSNAEVSRAARFAGLSYQYRHVPWVLGAGAARIFLSPDEPDTTLEDTTQFETYVRYRLTKAWFVTADVQYLVNSNFERSSITRDRQVAVYGLRLSWLVE